MYKIKKRKGRIVHNTKQTMSRELMILYKSFRKHIKNTTIRKHVQFTSLFILPFTNFAFFNNELGYKVGYVQAYV